MMPDNRPSCNISRTPFAGRIVSRDPICENDEDQTESQGGPDCFFTTRTGGYGRRNVFSLLDKPVVAPPVLAVTMHDPPYKDN